MQGASQIKLTAGGGVASPEDLWALIVDEVDAITLSMAAHGAAPKAPVEHALPDASGVTAQRALDLSPTARWAGR